MQNWSWCRTITTKCSQTCKIIWWKNCHSFFPDGFYDHLENMGGRWVWDERRWTNDTISVLIGVVFSILITTSTSLVCVNQKRSHQVRCEAVQRCLGRVFIYSRISTFLEADGQCLFCIAIDSILLQHHLNLQHKHYKVIFVFRPQFDQFTLSAIHDFYRAGMLALIVHKASSLFLPTHHSFMIQLSRFLLDSTLSTRSSPTNLQGNLCLMWLTKIVKISYVQVFWLECVSE